MDDKDPRAPMVGVVAHTGRGKVNLICPHCEAINSILEVDTSERINHIGAVSRPNGVVLHVGWETGEAHFDHHHFFCETCTNEVSLPEDYVGRWF